MKIREAVKEDLRPIVKMLADDHLGAEREEYDNPLPEDYYKAFDNIQNDSNQELMVVQSSNHEIVGVFQLSFIQYLTYRGGIRSQVEGVRIRKDVRGKGIGRQMINWAISRAKERGAHVLQLTTDKSRPDALKFYQSAGFEVSHDGLKLHFN